MTNAKADPSDAGANSSFGFFRSSGVVVSSWVIHALIFIIRLYRWTISPVLPFLFGPTGGCRFTPSCSQYAMDVIRSRGVWAGGGLAVKRICRCHPWGGCGHDPAPGKRSGIRSSELGI